MVCGSIVKCWRLASDSGHFRPARRTGRPCPGKAGRCGKPIKPGQRWPVYDGGGTWGGSRMLDLRRRDFVSLLGGAAVGWPLAAQAQQPQMPVIGILSLLSPEFTSERLRGFRQGLKESGYIEGENVVSEYRWAGNQVDRLPSLAAELV